MSNSITIIDREMAAPQIEGVDFGGRLWVIARSPTAVLAWVYGHTSSINGHRSYATPHLLILPDRTERFMGNPRYLSLRHDWTRLTPERLEEFHASIVTHFGLDAYSSICRAIKDRMTVIIEGGGGQLMPFPKLWGQAYSDWIKNPDNGFIPRAEVAKGPRHKLGYGRT